VATIIQLAMRLTIMGKAFLLHPKLYALLQRFA
jgi:hypothetical protein